MANQLTYVGNPDFRGYIASVAPEFLDYVGNDGGVNMAKLSKAGGVESNYAQQSLGVNAAANTIKSLYGNYQKAAPAVGAGGNGPADLSAYDQGIDSTNASINAIDPATANAVATAENNYQTTLNSLAEGKAQTDKTYNANKTDNSQNFVTAKNTINTNTGQTINSVNRVGGARGAGGQTALDYAAEIAAGQGSQQRTAAGTTFAKNGQALDDNYGTYNQGYEKNVTNAGKQKENDVNSAKSSAAVNKANLLQSLATLINQRTAAAGGSGTAASQPYVDQARTLLGQATAYATPQPVAPQAPVTYTPPPLASYLASPTAVAPGANASAATDTVGPFLPTLTNRKQLQLA